MKFEIEATPLPESKPAGGGKKGSKYMNADIIEAADALEVGVNSFVVPQLPDTKVDKMLTQTRWELNKHYENLFKAIPAEQLVDGQVAKKFSAALEKNAEGVAIGIRIGRKA